MTTVVCAGHVNWDVTLRVVGLPSADGEASISDQTRAGGGSAANTAVALTGLDVGTALLGSVGTAEDGRRATEELTATGVDCTHLQRVDGPTTTKYLVVDDAGEVMVLANDGVNEAFESADLPREALEAADHLHLTSQRFETALDLATRAREQDCSVSFDPGRRIEDRDYRQVVTHVDYLFCNDREASVARENGLVDAVEGRAVVTRGADGGELLAGGPTHDGYDVDVVDTTGAGDAFTAGFLAAMFGGADHGEALAVANACGALAARSIGARTALSWDAIENLRS